jgi:glycerol-3-phosphate acyltransferase PlsX
MRIAVDAMGGDHAPRVVVDGAVRAAAAFPAAEIVLIGRRDDVQPLLREFPDTTGRVRIEHAETMVAMGDSPVEALRKKGDTSIGRCAELAKNGEADAIVSAGNTGAAVAAATLAMRLLEGVRKPGIAAPFPTVTGSECLVIDVGANVKPKPEHLLHYGIMGAEHVKAIVGKDQPRVGLLNVGEEDAKGNELTRDTHALFKQTQLNFIGNVEGHDIFQDHVDVAVCDGFVGNVLLKVAEGVCEAVIGMLRDSLSRKLTYRLAAGLCRPALKRLYGKLSSSVYGGAQLLGVNGICIISHGSANAEAIFNAIRVALDLSQKHVNDRIIEAVKQASSDASDEPATAQTG